MVGVDLSWVESFQGKAMNSGSKCTSEGSSSVAKVAIPVMIAY